MQIVHAQQREVKRLQNDVKSLEKDKEELSGKLKKEKETVKSKMAEIEVLKEWEKASVIHVYYIYPAYWYIHVELYVFHIHTLLLCDNVLYRR